MDWHKFFSLKVGEAVAADPAEALSGVEPIIELSETVKPRLVVAGRHPDGSDLMAAILEDSAAGTFTFRGRYRLPDGRKVVAPPVRWLPAEDGDVPRALAEVAERTEQTMREHGAVVTRLAFKSGARFEEIIEAFVRSGAFDVLRGDEEKQEIRRLA